MSSPHTQGKRDDLQFDRAQTGANQPGERTGPAVSCDACNRSIETYYYHVNGKSVCKDCRQKLERELAGARGTGALARALIFGIGAAIAGAAIYYAVIAIADLEIGIVAILIGYMVGYSVRKGASGHGGRRYQIIAAVLTYWAVGLAYSPLAFKGMVEGKGPKAAATRTADSSGTTRVIAESATANAEATDSAPTRAVDSSAVTSTITQSPKSESSMGFAKAFGILVLFVFALPIVAVLGTMPSGLISALIIFIGMRQAWKMTAQPKIEITGPYKVGAGPAPAAS